MKYHCRHGETPNLFGSAVIVDHTEPTTGKYFQRFKSDVGKDRLAGEFVEGKNHAKPHTKR